MARTCTVCRHPQRKEVEQDIVRREPERAIAGHYGLSRGAIHRHKNNCLPEALAHAADRRMQKQEDELLDYAIANQDARLAAQNERWQLLKQRVLDSLEDPESFSDSHRLLRELRELEKQVSQELNQFAVKSEKTRDMPAVVIIQPRGPLPPGVTADLPVLRRARFPDGRPAGFIEEAETVDVEADLPDENPEIEELETEPWEIEGD